MKRDMDLIRTILQTVESCDSSFGLDEMPEIDGYSRPVVSYHLKLLRDAGLIEAHVINEVGADCADFVYINLTWSGQDFLRAAANDTLWRKAKETILKPGVSYTFDLLFAWLKDQAKTTLGLP